MVFIPKVSCVSLSKKVRHIVNYQYFSCQHKSACCIWLVSHIFDLYFACMFYGCAWSSLNFSVTHIKVPLTRTKEVTESSTSFLDVLWMSLSALDSVIMLSLAEERSFSCSCSFFSSRGMTVSWSRIDSTCLHSFDLAFFSAHKISGRSKRRILRSKTM